MQKLKIEIDNIFYALHTINPKKGKERNAIEVVLKEPKRLQEDYISKDKIREKIEEQKELKEKYLKMREYGQVDIRLYKIAILEELLEGK